MVLFKENVFWQKSKILLVKDSEIREGGRENSIRIQNVKNSFFLYGEVLVIFSFVFMQV